MIQRLDYAFDRESTYDAELNVNKLNPANILDETYSLASVTTGPRCSARRYSAKITLSGAGTIRITLRAGPVPGNLGSVLQGVSRCVGTQVGAR